MVNARPFYPPQRSQNQGEGHKLELVLQQIPGTTIALQAGRRLELGGT